ncbi:hypothetical protein ACFL47_09315 [Candidatus Latescibacterota bacterium]
MKYFRVVTAFIACILLLVASCSHEEISSYDDLEQKGEVEKIVRKKYAGFFKDLEQFTSSSGAEGDTPVDSTFFKKVAESTDLVIADFSLYPRTVEARLAFDALSFAASDMTISPHFSVGEVAFFWQNALLFPLMSKAHTYVKSETPNASTQMQLVKAIKRGMGKQATNSMLIDLIPVIGPNPSPEIMEICKNDSLAFRRVHDLLIYTRSLQQFGPPPMDDNRKLADDGGYRGLAPCVLRPQTHYHWQGALSHIQGIQPRCCVCRAVRRSCARC